MENSETKEQVINLGKTIVQELGLEPGVDTLSRWMSHYIAELIKSAETSSADEKDKLEKECLETILKVWEKRAYYPDGRRPFEEFESVFHALQSLAPDSNKPFYRPLSDYIEADDESEHETEVANWLKRTIEISKFTKRLQRYCLSKAFHSAKTEKTKKWLEHVKDPDLFEDTKAIIELKWYSEEFSGMSEEEQDKVLQTKGIESLLSDIDKQIDLLNKIKNTLQKKV